MGSYEEYQETPPLILITWEITSCRGALSQEPETNTKFAYFTILYQLGSHW